MADTTTTVNHTNTPIGVAQNQTLEHPSGFFVDRLDCINKYGTRQDIRPIVTEFTITEELFSPILVINLRVRDTVNFFENFKLSGEEKIEIKLSRRLPRNTQDATFTNVSEISLSFLVKEYPNYRKSASEPNIQEYNIIAISEHGYNSMLKKISKSVKGNPIKNAIGILFSELKVMCEEKVQCMSSFEGVITISSPLKAVEWLRSKAFDIVGSPMVIYTTITSQGYILISSLAELWSDRNKVAATYEYRQYVVNSRKNAEQFFTENATRILDMQSEIKLDKLEQARAGAFSSTTKSTDIASKTFIEKVFSYNDDETFAKNYLNNSSGGPFALTRTLFGKLLSDGSSEPQSLDKISTANLTNIATNSGGITGGVNASTMLAANAAKAKAFYSNFESVNHQIQVYGDFNLNPGRKLSIKIPKTHITKAGLAGTTDNIDNAMSGNYIIIVAAHTFCEGIYTSKLKISKEKV